MDSNQLVVIGAGTIGSHLLRHLARLPEVEGITVVDFDRYQEKNLASQDITIADLGRFKPDVQKRHLKRIRQNLRVVPIRSDVNHVPLARLRSKAIFSCVDSRAARQTINRIAWRLGVPWIDGGIEPSGQLARVRMHRPSRESACHECSWSAADYAALDQAYPCQQAQAPSSRPAASASSLGALAAALQAIEGEKLVRGQWDEAAEREVLIAAGRHKHYVSRFERNAQCRFDHEIWNVERLDCGPQDLTLGVAFEMGRGNCEPKEPLSMQLEPHRFVRKLVCSGCGAESPLLRLEISLGTAERVCPRCGSGLIATGFNCVTRLERDAVPRQALAQTLGQLGIRKGDIYTISSPHGEKHFEIPCDSE